MTTISVPLKSDLEESLYDLLDSRRYGSNKADVLRYALSRLVEDAAVNDVLEAQRQIVFGKGMKGDLRKIAKKFK